VLEQQAAQTLAWDKNPCYNNCTVPFAESEDYKDYEDYEQHTGSAAHLFKEA
jgi:hypothetical protein